MIDNPTKRMKLSKKERMKVLNKCNSRCAYCECGEHHDRDWNAAINIKREGTRILTA